MLNRTLRALNRLVVRRSAGVGLDVRVPDRAAASVALRAQGTSRRVRLLGALSLAALLLAAAAALPLQAQTTTVTLVSNIAESSAGGSTNIRAQSFRTGSEPLGYRISEVHLSVTTATGKQTSVTIRADDSGSPGDLADTLINPTLTSNSTLTFTPSSALALDPNKTYWLTANEGIASNRVFYRVTESDVDTSDQSWSIGNGSLATDSINEPLSPSIANLLFEISGTVNSSPTDVTLARVLLGNAFGNTTNSRITAQKFTTGPNPLGYSISQIRIRMGSAANHVVGKDIIVRIKADGVNNRPGDLVATLTNPASLGANSLKSFTAPPGTILDPDTSYWLTVNEGLPTNSGMAAVRISLNQSDDSNYGWDIANGRLYKSPTTNWAHANNAIIFQVRGTVRVASTDATLSDLRVTHGGGSPVALSPGFSSDEFEYNASVEFPVSQVTVTPTKNHPLASVKFRDVRDGSNNQLSDADTSRSGFQANLVAGAENVIKVEVTAEDGTTQPYTVIVTRAAEPGQVLLSTKSLSLTEGEVSPGYTLVLDRRPSSSVTVAVAGHAGTPLTRSPSSLTFSTSNWNQPQWVSVAAAADSNTTNESVTLTHTATSSDSLFDGITIPSVIVNVDDQDPPDYHIRTIAVPQGSDALPLGEKALPDEEINVLDGTSGSDVYIHVVAEGDIWRPSGLWGDVDKDTIWVVDPERFGIHPLKLSALKQGRIERHVAPDSNSFDYRFNYNCHFSRDRVGGLGNRSLTVISGNDTTIWVANDTSNRLEAYRRDGSLTSGCYVAEVTDLTSSNVDTADKPLKTPFTRVSGRDYDMFGGIDGAHALTVWGIWSNGTKMWVNGPPYGIKTLDLNGGRLVKAPGFDGHISGYGLWSDGETMWVATYGWLRAYDLDTGIRRAALDVRLRSYRMPPGGLWSDGETIWVTNRIGTIDAYRLPGRSGRSRTPRATEADPLTASFASAAEAHDGENRFKLRIAFSDDVEITPEDMRDHALLVSGGTVTDAARVKGRSDLWELTVEPAGPGPVSVLAPLGRACTDQGALCTADGRSLTAGPALVVPGRNDPTRQDSAGRRPAGRSGPAGGDRGVRWRRGPGVERCPRGRFLRRAAVP